MVNTHCVTTTPMQKVKGQGHMRPKTDSEPGEGIIFDRLWLSSF